MSSERHILLIAVGPVQPFIAAARKIRDLWAGSKMLAEMAGAVVKQLRDEHCTFVFPSPVPLPSDLEPERDFGAANKILALTPPGASPEKLADAARTAFNDKLKGVFNELDQWLKAPEFAQCVDRERLVRQRADYGEFYAVWVRCRDDDDYDRARLRAERLLAARKMTRNFSPPRWDPYRPQKPIDGKRRGVRKNTLDGARETVFSEFAVGQDSALVRERHLIKLNEHLDALGLAKRWHGMHSREARSVEFQTLSDVALAPYREGIATDKHLAELLEKAETAIAELPVGAGERGTLLYRDRLVVALRELGMETEAAGRNVLNALDQLHRSTGEPPAYGCILQGDGDHMGEALDGLKRAEHHQAFSAALTGFARDLDEIVARHGGSLIYSGGDDVLAFLPVHTALQCSVEIRGRFTSAMAAAAKEIAPGDPPTAFGRKKAPTFSTGLAIVHHLEALYTSLETARRAERNAKQDYKRDALAVIQSIRGGGELLVGGKWDGPVQRLLRFVGQFQQNKISGRLAYQLRSVVKTLGCREGAFDFKPTVDSIAHAVAAEALRIGGDSTVVVQELKACGNIREIADELVVAQLIARTCTLAKGVFR